MTLRIHAAPKIDRGLVLVIEGNTVIKYCELVDVGIVACASDLERLIDVYLHPTDAEAFDVWLTADKKRRLN